MRRTRTPQDKKADSLAHDRRNTYGEHDKSSRTAIRQRKRLCNRLRRQALRRALEHSQATADEAGIDVPRPRGQWRKSPDSSLGVVLYHRRLHRLERDLRARLRIDPEFLDRLEPAAITAGLGEVEARMLVREFRAAQVTWQRHAPRIPDDALAVLARLIRHLA